MSKVARGVPQINSDIAGARNPLTMGKLFGVRETTAPLMTLALPSVFRMKSTFTTSLSAGNSVHFASKRSEERRVGKECRSRLSPDYEKKKKREWMTTQSDS